MSFGDPNNPYGPPQQPQPGQPPQQPGYPSYPTAPQPGYGYPTAPQPGQGYPTAPQPGQGYPQAPPVPQGYGYPMQMPMQMPGIVMTARVLLFILAGFQFLAAVIFGILVAVAGSSDADTGMVAGVVAAVALLMLALGSLSVFLGVKMRNGRGGIRIGTMIYASLMILGSLVNIGQGVSETAAAGALGGIISLAFGITILVGMIKGGDWFNRPRY
ncbi:hypothetical protein [Streptomyces griseoruber]|uniref:Uncharacterized protein n=1 Tax=Streptomyces griseoruber TaxID=1943 RepID=A0A117RD95_9ACTN|nr:hypothetical protein [Streptomyces griseoruber]KUN84404.1 hypothetical protein AQJ64_14760 [Streptomyces griseoruber]